MKISYMLVNNSGHGLSMPTGAAWHWIHEVEDEKQMRSILERLKRISSGIDGGAHLHPQVLADLVTDHAGEVGAVCIYQGVLRIARDPALRAFAQRHLATEQNHLRQIETWLPPDHYSHLLPVWRLAGFLTGALPALLGPKAVYATIEAVETFVDHHYEEQIRVLATKPALSELRQTQRNHGAGHLEISGNGQKP